MPNILSENGIKYIAFYLPQFHCIPENDKAFGKGFTEWTNVKKAKPLFAGHYQPREPLNDNYYNLLDNDVMRKQAELAKTYGVYGFCFYHYWFGNGKKLLEKPVEKFLSDSSIDIPFCLCWANENWAKKWDGGNNEIIVKQDYGNAKTWSKHLDYLVNFFKDERYITFNGSPILLIYKPEEIPHFNKMLSFFKKEIKKYGFKDLIIISQYPKFYINGYNRKFVDYFVDFEPAYTRLEEEYLRQSNVKKNLYKIAVHLNKQGFFYKIYRILLSKSHKNTEKKLEIRSYDKDWAKILNRNINDNNFILGAFVDWDNTSRNSNGVAYVGANPDKFKKYLHSLCEKNIKEKRKNIIFINAWNEWAEGAYLEPDKKFRYGYLEALKETLEF